MFPEYASNPSQSTDAASAKTGRASAIGRAKPQISPAEVVASFAITPAMRAWSQPAKAGRCPASVSHPFDAAAGCAGIPLPGWKRALDRAARLLALT